MASDLELAVLAYRSYRPSDSNDVTAPSWIETLVRNDPSSGFAASVYTNGDEVVIAFRGTDTPQWRDFLYGNVPAARGAGGRADATAWLDHGGAVICGSVVRGRGVKEGT